MVYYKVGAQLLPSMVYYKVGAMLLPNMENTEITEEFFMYLCFRCIA